MTLIQDPNQLPILMSYREVAVALRVHPDTVRAMVKRGTLPAPVVLTPRTHRFYTEEINAYMRKNAGKP